MQICKFLLSRHPVTVIAMPKGAIILSAQYRKHLDGIRICLWALVNPSEPMESRKFLIIQEDQDFPEMPVDYNYIGTVQNEQLTWHVFEVIRQPPAVVPCQAQA